MCHSEVKQVNIINMRDRRHAGVFAWRVLLVAIALVFLLVFPLLQAALFQVEARQAQEPGSNVDWKSILESVDRSSERDLDAHLMLAVSFANLGMIPEATTEFRMIESFGHDEFGERVIRENDARVKDSPNDIVSLNKLAFAYYAFGDYPKSVDCFQALMRLEPMNIWIHHYYAYSLSRVDRMDEAIDVLKAALAIDPSNEYTHLLLGLAYREKGWHLLSVLELARGRNAVRELSRLVE